MGFRNYDWECTACGRVGAQLVWVWSGKKPPRRAKLDCGICGEATKHQRRISAPAQYMGEKSRSPIVYGGKFDTAGQEALPELPDIPPALDGEGVRDVFHSKEWKDAKRRRAEVMERNKAKRKRLAAHKRTNGGVDFRRNRLKGDPKLTG